MSSSSLCSTCNHLTGCSLRASTPDGIWHCSEFDDSTPRVALEPAAQLAAVVDPFEGRPRPAGICVNCEVLSTCRFPKPDGGIWRCEEYR